MKSIFFMLALALIFWNFTACNSDSKKNDNGDTGTSPEDNNPFRPIELENMARALAIAVEGKGNPEKASIAVVANLQSDFWHPNQIGISAASGEIGCIAIFDAPLNGELSEQLAILQNRIDNKYTGMAVSPIDPAGGEPTLAEAEAQGISVITFDSEAVANSVRKLYLGTINRDAGRQAGMKMAQLLGSTGKVAAFAGIFTDENNASERYVGIQEALATTNVELLPPYADDAGKAVARQNVELAISQHPDLTGIITIWSYNGPEAARAVEALGKTGQIKIVAFDLEPDTIYHLDAGVINAAVVQRPYWMGYRSVYILYAMNVLGADATRTLLAPWFEESGNFIINTGTDVITGENLDVYRDYLQSLGISSS
ncbi:MAG: substrate-binding domain-containing protein [Deltaproteobacteria bacterium]|nr:substrate-binding domain-containing protein [Deltaproteobacteria bacterium]